MDFKSSALDGEDLALEAGAEEVALAIREEIQHRESQCIGGLVVMQSRKWKGRLRDNRWETGSSGKAAKHRFEFEGVVWNVTEAQSCRTRRFWRLHRDAL